VNLEQHGGGEQDDAGDEVEDVATDLGPILLIR
jgi:hypothetical protein